MDKTGTSSSSRLRKLGFRFMPTLITVVIVAGIFYFYLTVIVNRNEVELQERKFRGLHQIAENLKLKIERYQEKNVHHFLVHFGSLNIKGKKISTKADTLIPNQALRKEYGLSEWMHNDTTKKKDIVVSKRYQNLEIDAVEKRIIFYKQGKDSSASTLISDFLEPLLRKSVFSNYLLAFNGKIIYDELNNSYDTLQHFISKSVEKDSIRNVSYNPTGQVLTVTVGGKKYRLFTQRFIVSQKESFSIGGYLPEDEYLQESNYVPTYLIVWMIIGIVLAIILVPLVRVFLLHASEQLTTMAATSAFAAAHVLASLTMLTLMGVFLYFIVFRQSDNKKLKDLAVQIEINLNEEITTGIETVKKANELLLTKTHSRDVLLLKKSADIISGKSVGDSMPLDLLKRQEAPEFSHIIWVDSSGQQLLRWTTDVTVPVKISVLERDYFQAILKDNVFYTDKNEPYFFGAISSWVSSKSLAAISLPYKYYSTAVPDKSDSLLPNLKAVYMTGQFQSLYAPVFPNGYGFCIIDETGKVLFHKDEQKNLTENFIRECSNPSDVKTRISNRIEGYFDANYMGLFQRFFYHPIGGTKYSVITYKDKQVTWEEDLDIITVCSILLLTNLILILAVFLHIRFTSYTNSRIKERGFSFTWLRPNFNLKSDYIFISLFYALSMLLQTSYLLLGTGDDNAGILESTFAYSYILLLATHHRFAMVLDPQEPPRKLQKRFLLLLIPYITLTVLFMLLCTSDCLLPLAVQSAHILLYAFVTPRIIRSVTSWNRSINNKLGSMSKWSLYYWRIFSVNMTFRRIFTSFAFSLILATSVIPVLIFYSLCYHEESHQSVAFAQLDFARRLPRDSAMIRRFGKTPVSNNIHNPYYYKPFADILSLDCTTKFTAQGPTLFSRIYSYIKPSFSRYSKQLELMGDAKGVDDEFYWTQKPGSDELALHYRFGARVSGTGNTDAGLQVAGPKLPFDWKITSGRNQSVIASRAVQSSILLIIFVSLILLTGFYMLISKLVRKIFFEGSADSSYLKETNREVADIFQIRGNLFVHAMPGSDTFDRESWEPSAKFLDSGNEVLAMIKVPALPAKSFVISGINPLRTDHTTLDKLVGFVERLITEKRKVVLISNINQHRFSSAFQQQQELSVRWETVRKSLYHVNAGCADIFASRQVPKSDTTDLEVKVIESIDRIYKSSRHQPPLNAEEKDLISKSCSHLVDKLVQECRYTDFLPTCFLTLFNFSSRMSVSIFEDIAEVPRGALKKVVENRLKFVFENACLQLKEIATNFYEELWCSFDLDEQRTLYDIAIDDLVNPANRKTAARLAELGIIRAEKYISCYHLFNESFRSFVFDHVAKNEITAFKAEIKQQGRTGNFLLPLGITIVACIVFIFTTQKDAFLDLITYLGAAAAGITGILKVISIIPNSKSAAS